MGFPGKQCVSPSVILSPCLVFFFNKDLVIQGWKERKEREGRRGEENWRNGGGKRARRGREQWKAGGVRNKKAKGEKRGNGDPKEEEVNDTQFSNLSTAVDTYVSQSRVVCVVCVSGLLAKINEKLIDELRRRVDTTDTP